MKRRKIFFSELQALIADVPRHDISMALLDANATVSAPSRNLYQPPVSGNSFLDLTTNDNGDRLLELCSLTDHCLADTWFPRKRIHYWTWYSNDGTTRKALDHILVCRRWRSSVTNCRVYRGAQLGNTDHRMLVATLRLKLKADPTNKYQPKIDASRLKDPLLAQAYSCSISNRFSALAADERGNWPTFKTSVLESAANAVGYKKAAARKPWISSDTLRIIEARRAARLNGHLDEYRQLNRIRNEALRADRERFWDDQAKQLENAARQHDQGKVYQLLRTAGARNLAKIGNVKAADGRLLTEDNDCRNRWAEHFKTLLNRPSFTIDPYLEETANSSRPTTQHPACPTDPVLREEVKAAIAKLHNNKAPGVCNIVSEMLKSGGEHLIDWITSVINQVWSSELAPADWQKGIILPFWKRKGDKHICDNYRGITLLSVPGKLFTRILLKRALMAIQGSRRPQQAGFMPNRSTTDHISCIRLLIEKHREFRKDRQLFIAFIDLKAAFDSVHRASLWKILRLLGVPLKLCNLFKNVYDSSKSCVRVNGKLSDWFDTLSGVRQGCVAAPDLFNCMVDYLMEKVAEKVPGIQLGSYRMTDLEYADDTLLLGSSLEDIRQALTTYEIEAAKLGLKVNWTKTKLMRVGDGPDPPSLIVNGETVEFVPSFVYLGSTVSHTGDLSCEVNRRRGLASGVMRALWNPLWRQRCISRKTKCRIYNAAVLSVLMYGAETWPLSQSLAQRIAGFDSKALRMLLNVRWTDRISNSEIRSRTEQPSALRLLAQRRIRWLGHLCRLPDSHPTKVVAFFDPGGAGWRRPRGAPRTRWIDVVRKDMAQLDIRWEDVSSLAVDRPRWRGVVHRVGSTPSWHEQ